MSMFKMVGSDQAQLDIAALDVPEGIRKAVETKEGLADVIASIALLFKDKSKEEAMTGFTMAITALSLHWAKTDQMLLAASFVRVLRLSVMREQLFNVTPGEDVH
jgi:hypothetical protein